MISNVTGGSGMICPNLHSTSIVRCRALAYGSNMSVNRVWDSRIQTEELGHTIPSSFNSPAGRRTLKNFLHPHISLRSRLQHENERRERHEGGKDDRCNHCQWTDITQRRIWPVGEYNYKAPNLRVLNLRKCIIHTPTTSARHQPQAEPGTGYAVGEALRTVRDDEHARHDPA